MNQMRVNCEIRADKIVIIRPYGDFINNHDIDNLDMWIRMMRDMEVQHIIYDLQHIGHLNSLAIASLLDFHTYLDKHAGRLVLVNLNPDIKEMFKVSKLPLFFEIHDSVPDAIKALQS